MAARRQIKACCVCPSCRFVSVYPELPSLDPPTLAESWEDPKAEWTLACHWLGPIRDGKALLFRQGFKTDGASIPRSVWPVVGHPFQLPLLPYALDHDGAYAAELFPRAVCDSRFLENMVADKHIGWVKRNAVWTAVQTCGWTVWLGHLIGETERARTFVRVVGEEEYNAISDSRRFPV